MKIAMIGTGGIARRHLGVLNNEPEIEVVGHVSPTTAHAAAAAERWGGRAYPTIAPCCSMKHPTPCGSACRPTRMVRWNKT